MSKTRVGFTQFRAAPRISANSSDQSVESNILPVLESPDPNIPRQSVDSLTDNSDLTSVVESNSESKPARATHKHKLTKARAAALSLPLRGFVVSCKCGACG